MSGTASGQGPPHPPGPTDPPDLNSGIARGDGEGDRILADLEDLLARAAASEDGQLRDRVRVALQRAVPRFAAPYEAEGSGSELPRRFGIIAASEPMKRVFELLEKFIGSDYPVLIQGESGTGKELVARALHAHGKRAKKPFVSENCAAIPETLLESILFGHAKGSFTGAHRDNPGHFVTADGGTLFLDEVGDMSPGMQTKLLRVLEDGEVRPVGGKSVRKVNVRVVAASNKDLRDLVARKGFREDLFFRLNVLTLRLPPLRERGEDIDVLARFFLSRAAAEAARPLRLAPESVERLRRYPWPGNVRQLENEIRRAVALTDGEVIGPGDLSPEVGGS